jgi:hypothetical protein
LLQVTGKEQFIREEMQTTTTKIEGIFKYVSGKKRKNNPQLSNIYSSSFKFQFLKKTTWQVRI